MRPISATSAWWWTRPWFRSASVTCSRIRTSRNSSSRRRRSSRTGPQSMGRTDMSEARTRVLIVDDELFFLEAIDEILSGAGFETVRAEDGQSALEAAASAEVGVVVLDVRLPDV